MRFDDLIEKDLHLGLGTPAEATLIEPKLFQSQQVRTPWFLREAPQTEHGRFPQASPQSERLLMPRGAGIIKPLFRR